MPMDGLMLSYIARELSSALVGGRVDKIAQPERDEVILSIRSRGQNYLLLVSASAGTARIHFTAGKKGSPLEPPMFCMLLRKHLGGGRVSAVTQVCADRILEIQVENLSELGDQKTMRLVCEFMGKHSNLILVAPDGRIIDSARHVTYEVSRVREVLPGLPYDRPPAHDKLPFDSLDEGALLGALRRLPGPLARALAQAVSGLSRQSAQELAMRALGSADIALNDANAPIAAQRIADFLQHPPLAAPRIALATDGTPMDLTPFPYQLYGALAQRPFDTLSLAADQFYCERDLADRIQQKSAALRRVLRGNIARCEKKLTLQLEALEGSRRMEEYRVKGELLTAAQGTARKGQKSVLLTNYYDPDCAQIEVELDERLSPAQNAQHYFKLYQKARTAQVLAAEQKEKTEEELSYLEGQLLNLEACEDEASLNEIREELEKQGYVRANHNRRQIKKLPPSQPLHMLSSSGRHILVGRNNLQNDKLTQTADPGETWLHAKDMPGSHVIIVGPDPDEQTLRDAALLAARYSRGATSSQVPVDYTLRKYVKKPAGAKPGFVIYTHQRTLFVTPSEENLAGVRRAE